MVFRRYREGYRTRAQRAVGACVRMYVRTYYSPAILRATRTTKAITTHQAFPSKHTALLSTEQKLPCRPILFPIRHKCVSQSQRDGTCGKAARQNTGQPFCFSYTFPPPPSPLLPPPPCGLMPPIVFDGCGTERASLIVFCLAIPWSFCTLIYICNGKSFGVGAHVL